MNFIFKPFIRKFILVLFDDILVYSKDWATHLDPLREILQLLRKHQLFAKTFKCTFAVMQIDYWGHVIKESKLIRRS